LGETFDHRGFPDTGFPDEHRVVLRPAGEHLRDASNLSVSTDDRVEFSLAGNLGEVLTKLLQGRLVLPLGVLLCH